MDNVGDSTKPLGKGATKPLGKSSTKPFGKGATNPLGKKWKGGLNSTFWIREVLK